MKKTLQKIVASVSTQSLLKSNQKNTCSVLLTRGYKIEAAKYENKNKNKNKKVSTHPYKCLHPWKSVEIFSNSLVDNLIYNQDGIVVLNKPYGISNNPQTLKDHEDPEWNSAIGIPNSVDYTLSDALPIISKTLGYQSLFVVKSPERNISGVSILVDDERKAHNVRQSLHRARCANNIINTHWIVTTKLPICNGGEVKVAITKKESPCQSYKQPIILNTWKNNEVKRGEVKILNVSYCTLSTSIGSLSALMEIKFSTTKWHSIRVFSSTVLFSPILGDRIHGSRVKKVMGTYMNISPFVEAARELPVLQQALLEKLQLTPKQRVIIPTHIHLREVTLPSFLAHGKDLKLVAPLPPYFQWTCDRLQFKIPTENEEVLSKLRLAATQ